MKVLAWITEILSDFDYPVTVEVVRFHSAFNSFQIIVDYNRLDSIWFTLWNIDTVLLCPIFTFSVINNTLTGQRLRKNLSFFLEFCYVLSLYD